MDIYRFLEDFEVCWKICLANQTSINLTEALSKNLEKKSIRDADRHANNPKLKP